jgi:hypothetical protein
VDGMKIWPISVKSGFNIYPLGRQINLNNLKYIVGFKNDRLGPNELRSLKIIKMINLKI